MNKKISGCERREIECGLVGRLLEVDYFRRLTTRRAALARLIRGPRQCESAHVLPTSGALLEVLRQIESELG